MASADAYNLLVIDDIDQDKILYNSNKLKETIALSKYRNEIKLNQELSEIGSQIENINNMILNSKAIRDDSNSKDIDEEVSRLEITVSKLKEIYTNKSNYRNNIINPSVEDLKQTMLLESI